MEIKLVETKPIVFEAFKGHITRSGSYIWSWQVMQCHNKDRLKYATHTIYSWIEKNKIPQRCKKNRPHSTVEKRMTTWNEQNCGNFSYRRPTDPLRCSGHRPRAPRRHRRRPQRRERFSQDSPSSWPAGSASLTQGERTWDRAMPVSRFSGRWRVQGRW